MPLYYANPRHYSPSPFEMYQEQLRAAQYRELQEQLYRERARQAYLEEQAREAYLERLCQQKLQERLENIYRERSQYSLEQLVEARVNQHLAELGLYQRPKYVQPVQRQYLQQERQSVEPEEYYYAQPQRQPQYKVYFQPAQAACCKPNSKKQTPEPVSESKPQYVKIHIAPQATAETAQNPQPETDKQSRGSRKCDSKQRCQKARRSEKTFDTVKSSINSVFDVIEHLMNQQPESSTQYASEQKTESKPVKIDIQADREPLSMIEKLKRNSEVLLEPKEPTAEDIKDDASETSNLSMVEILKMKSEAILEEKQEAPANNQATSVPEEEPAEGEQILAESAERKAQEQRIADAVPELVPVNEDATAENGPAAELQAAPELKDMQMGKHESRDTLISDEKLDEIQSPKSTISDTFEMVANQ
ncbi:hypothetical protein HDV01_006799 [Terramyces sp. JEL0728]|nr:hypothetical protein HDV01_006799 [Terramyces sp. JEL0728]